MIRQIYREEFEQSGVEDVRKRATGSIYSGDKLLEALKWLNKKDHGGLAKEQIAIARDADAAGNLYGHPKAQIKEQQSR